MAVKKELTTLTSEVTIVPADDPARASWFLGARLSAQSVRSIIELREIVDQRITGARARVARAETELAEQLAADLNGNNEADDDALIAQATAIKLAVGLPPDADTVVRRLRREAEELSAALTSAAGADGASAAAERRLEALAPGGDLTVDVELLRETSQDVILAESAARSAQHDLGAAAGAVRPEKRIALRVAGRRAFDADLRYKSVLRETRPLVAAAIALIVVAAATLVTGAAGAISWPAAAALSGVLVVVALAAMLQRHRAVRPVRRACVDTEAEARQLGDDLRKQEDQFGDWGVRVMKSMAADDALRGVLERWQGLAGRDVDHEHVDELIDAVAALDKTRARQRQAAETLDECAAIWLQTTSELGIAPEPTPEIGPTLELLEGALSVRPAAAERLHDLHAAERRSAARARLADLLRGRTIGQLADEAAELTAAAGDDEGGSGPLLFVDHDGVSPDGRIDLLQEAGRLGPEGRFVVVTTDPSEWNAARMAMPGADDRDAIAEIDLRDSVLAPAIPITEPRPWFAS